MGLFSKINPQKLINDVVSGIDKSILTNEEASEMNVAIWQAQLKFAEADASANTTSSKARRTLAFMVAGTYLPGKIIAGTLVLIGTLNPIIVDGINTVLLAADRINAYADSMGIYFGGIMTYYFGVYIFNKIKSTRELKNDIKNISDIGKK